MSVHGSAGTEGESDFVHYMVICHVWSYVYYHTSVQRINIPNIED